MWSLYCLPGRIITYFGFLFPKRGEYGASARRHESGCLAAVYSTLVYGFLIWLAVGYYHGGGNANRRSGQSSVPSTQVTNENAPLTTSEDVAPTVDDEPPRQARDVLPSPPIETAKPSVIQPPTSEVTHPVSAIERIVAAPREMPEIEAAIMEAAAAGEPKRWKTRDGSGYAVPSTAAANGCRQVRVSIDDQPVEDTKLITICPDDASKP